jgi:hypothetical protein
VERRRAAALDGGKTRPLRAPSGAVTRAEYPLIDTRPFNTVKNRTGVIFHAEAPRC